MLSHNRRSAPKRALETVTGRGRKSALERALETVGNSLDAIGDATPSLPDVASGRARKAGLIAAGSVAGLTVGSAAISSLRRRIDGTGDDS
jgi:hypothetical protein